MAVAFIDAFVDGLALSDLGIALVRPRRQVAGLCAGRSAEVLHLRLPQPRSVEPAAGRTRVCEDVIEGFVSAEKAREAFGVVLAGGDVAIDMAATESLRATCGGNARVSVSRAGRSACEQSG